jgi:SAM-dependent methyltransferase
VTIAAAERTLYEDVLALEHYGDFSPGVAYLPAFLDMIGQPRLDGCRVLDAGCATGKGAVALAEAGAQVDVLDLTYDGLVPAARGFPQLRPSPIWNGVARPGGLIYDYVYCCDVLEHVEPAFTMLCVDELLDIVSQGLFLSIALVPDQFGVWVGRPLHQTVQAFTWWRDHLAELGTVAEARDLGQVGLYLVTP